MSKLSQFELLVLVSRIQAQPVIKGQSLWMVTINLEVKPQVFLPPKNLLSNNFDPRKFWQPYDFDSSKMLTSQNFEPPKMLKNQKIYPKKLWTPQKFYTQKFWPLKKWWPFKKIDPEKCLTPAFWPPNSLTLQNIDDQIFYPTTLLASKNFALHLFQPKSNKQYQNQPKWRYNMTL